MSKLQSFWYGRHALTVFLIPLSWIFCGIVFLRRRAFKIGLLKIERLSVPVIVIGNITVGGTGKTPLVIWLANFLRNAGYFPAIVSRGYKGEAKSWPQQVRSDSDPVIVGDEAVLLAKRCQCPVAVGPDRVAAATGLLKYSDCDIIIADDGLQHYALGRNIEIAVIDGVRRFGNGYCIPAGPLREPVSRLKEVDFVVVNGGGVMRLEYSMVLAAGPAHNLCDDTLTQLPEEFRDQQVHAVAGIGNPDRFFSQLKRQGLDIIEHPFADHHQFRAEDILFDDDLPVLMTEKDAVKCKRFASARHWYLPVDAQPDRRVGERILALIKNLSR
jgi:tetraacyldisaccharide 4'-kinase